MRKLSIGLVSILILGLVACNSDPVTEPNKNSEVVLGVKSVELPQQAQATAPLDITVEVIVGGCISFNRLEVVSRTASQLNLRAIGTNSEKPGIVCTADIRWQKVPYTDPGSPARNNLFEVLVSGTSWGKISIQ
ncbi:hypothetical protein [Deinococcus sp.]|uniref:hypothetical protein n=1 Tax=Deinococcus sp. TaxID=47478 RepID=UPI0025BA12F5|nr:hypothetical protein [Deinococcus sp.]